MIGGSSLSSRAIGDGTRRALASEWGGPEPATHPMRRPVVGQDRRRLIVRKP